MKEQIEQLLTKTGRKFKSVMVLGTYIHIECHGEKGAIAAALLFPASSYSVKVFQSIQHKQVKDNWRGKTFKVWKCVAQVKG